MGPNASKIVQVVLPYPPSANRYWRNFRGRIVISAEARAYKLATKLKLKAMQVVPVASNCLVSAVVYRPARRGDLDNTAKCLLDACNGCLWLDDSQIVGLMLLRHDDKHNPRVELACEFLSQ
jgi:crossover junction endodeoxyribonuclease RusA